MPYEKYYENDALNRYLYIPLNEEEVINDYQMRVLENMSPDFALPASVVIKDNQQMICYTVNTRLDLETTLKWTKNLSRKQFEMLMKNILDVFLSKKRQQLKPNCFVVHPEFMFFKKNSMDFVPQFVYLPLEQKEDNVLDQFKSFIRYLIPLKVEYAADEMFYREVLEVTNSDTFTLNELKEILEVSSYQKSSVQDERFNQKDIVTSRASEELSKETNGSMKDNEKVKNTPIESMNKIESKDNQKIVMSSGLPIDKRTLIIVLIQVLFVLISVFVVIAMPIIEPKTIIGFILIMLTLNLLAVYVTIKKIPAKKNNNSQPDKYEDVSSEARSMVKKSAKKKVVSGDAIKQPQQRVRSDINEKTEILFPSISDAPEGQTEVLVERSKLIRLRDDVPITLMHGKTKIGRNNSNDIVIDNKTISGFHAELEYLDNTYYIKDLNSKNSTLLDGKKINPQELYPITDGTVLTFSDEDYRFQK